MSVNKLAIVIPFYKKVFFEDTLRSLINQTNQKFNVYIGNDASLDDPKDLIDKYNINNNINYVRFDENYGGSGKLVEQWERCIDLIKNEEWVIVLADDDYISENLVDVFYQNLSSVIEEKINVVKFSMKQVTHDNIFISQLEHPKIDTSINYLWNDQMKTSFTSISENIFNIKVYRKYRFRNYPLAWRVPLMFCLEFSEFKNIYGINNAFVYIRNSDIQLTRSYDKKNTMFKNEGMKRFYFDLLNEFPHYFNNNQNLLFLKIYTFYSKNNELSKPLFALYYKYGGIKETIKFIVKRIIYWINVKNIKKKKLV